MRHIDPRGESRSPQGDNAKEATESEKNNAPPSGEDDADDYFGPGDNPG